MPATTFRPDATARVDGHFVLRHRAPTANSDRQYSLAHESRADVDSDRQLRREGALPTAGGVAEACVQWSRSSFSAEATLLFLSITN